MIQAGSRALQYAHRQRYRSAKSLQGLNSIVSAISEMRNKDSDAHGVGSKRIPIRDYHARLFVNSAMTLADFILAVENNANTAHG